MGGPFETYLFFVAKCCKRACNRFISALCECIRLVSRFRRLFCKEHVCFFLGWVGSYRFSKGSVNPRVRVLRASGLQFLGLRTSVSNGGLKDGLSYKRFSVVRISDRDLKV